jgi:hypothetical protein
LHWNFQQNFIARYSKNKKEIASGFTSHVITSSDSSRLKINQDCMGTVDDDDENARMYIGANGKPQRVTD